MPEELLEQLTAELLECDRFDEIVAIVEAAYGAGVAAGLRARKASINAFS